MVWRKASFKDQEVWAEVGPDGSLKVNQGRVAIRYQSFEGAKIYGGGASRVSLLEDAPIEELPEGLSADKAKKAAPAKAGSGKSSGRGSGFGKAGTRTAQQAAMAKEAARKLISELESEGAILAFTDGACRGNPGPAGSGTVVIFPDGRRAEASQSLGKGTNNQAELTAISLALQLLEEAGIERDSSVALFTDSSYSNGVLTRGWKAKANVELIGSIKKELARWPGLNIHWIAGHVGVEGNERADTLANRGVEGYSESSWQ